MAIIGAFGGKDPIVHPSCFVARGAVVIGDVEVGEDTSIWYGCVIRGDVHRIRIGRRTNIQDLTMVHCTKDLWPTFVGDEVTVGHRATLHGCTVRSRSLIGMGAIVLDGAVVEENVLVGAGALVPPKMVVPQGSLVVGSPARVRRDLTQGELDSIAESAAHYIEYARAHQELGRAPFQGE